MTEEQLKEFETQLDLLAYRLDRIAQTLGELRTLATRVREGRT